LCISEQISFAFLTVFRSAKFYENCYH
jgi:hypothetical protein